MKTSRPSSFVSLIALAALPLAGAAGCARAGASERHAHPLPPQPESAVAVTTAVVAQKPIARALVLTGTLTPNRRSDVAADAIGKVIAAPIERGVDRRRRRDAGAPRPPRRRAHRRGSAGPGRLRAHPAGAGRHRVRARRQAVQRRRDHPGRARPRAHPVRRQPLDGRRRRRRARAWPARTWATRSCARRSAAWSPIAWSPRASTCTPTPASPRVVEIDPLRLELTVPEAAVGTLARAKEVVFEVAAFPGESFHGRVRYVGPAVRRQSRDLLVEAVVANPQRRLLPGMFATARLVLGSEPRPVVPADRRSSARPRPIASTSSPTAAPRSAWSRSACATATRSR